MKRIAKYITLLGLALYTLLGTGCASVASKSRYQVNITSNPSEVSFEIRNSRGGFVAQGRTPSSVTLKAGKGIFQPAAYDVTFSYDGQSYEQRFKARMDEWFYGNIILGGLLGVTIDGCSGAMFKLPEGLHQELPLYAQHSAPNVYPSREGFGIPELPSSSIVQDTAPSIVADRQALGVLETVAYDYDSASQTGRITVKCPGIQYRDWVVSEVEKVVESKVVIMETGKPRKPGFYQITDETYSDGQLTLNFLVAY